MDWGRAGLRRLPRGSPGGWPRLELRIDARKPRASLLFTAEILSSASKIPSQLPCARCKYSRWQCLRNSVIHSCCPERMGLLLSGQFRGSTIHAMPCHRLRTTLLSFILVRDPVRLTSCICTLPPKFTMYTHHLHANHHSYHRKGQFTHRIYVIQATLIIQA